MTLRRTGILILFFLVAYPMWVTGGTQTAWQLPMPVLAVLLLGITAMVSRRALWRDPITLIGMLFLLLLLVQWWNSSRPLSFNPLLQAWVFGPPPVPFLPASVSRPDAAEMLRWFFPVWAIALTTRHVVTTEDHRPLLYAILTAAAILAGGSIIQFAIATHWRCGQIPSRSYFVTSFGYANHAGSFFLLCFCVTVGGMLSALLKHRPTRTKVWTLLCCLMSFGGLLVSLSRSAALLAIVISVCSVIYVVTYRSAQSTLAVKFSRLMISLAIATAAFLLLFPLIGDPVINELSTRQPKTVDLSLPANWVYSAGYNIRPLYRKIAVNVLRDNFWFGAGGWSVRHLGILYVPQSQYPRLQTPGAANTHNDTLQFLSEFGVIGVGLLWAGVCIMAAPLFRHRARIWHSPKLVFSLLGLLAVAIQSFVDIPFRSPAILFLWTLILGLAASGISRRENRPVHRAVL